MSSAPVALRAREGREVFSFTPGVDLELKGGFSMCRGVQGGVQAKKTKNKRTAHRKTMKIAASCSAH